VLDILRDACETLMHAEQAFWLAAGIMDVSFETGGSRNLPPISAVEALATSLAARDLAARLQRGVNGELQRILTRQNPTIRMTFNQNRGRIRPDIQMFAPDRGDTVVEVKAVYCMTLDKFYARCGHGVCDDRDKLVALRNDSRVASRFQVVFFLELPNYHYPSGCSYAPLWKCHRARDTYIIHGQIESQFRAVRHWIEESPVWPSDPPYVIPLALPAPTILEALNRWFAEVFRPDDSCWAFDAAKQLPGAAVGCAIWSY
jgi:hypothetical protein